MKHFIRLLLLILIVSVFNSCEKDDSQNSELKILKSNYQKWKTSGITTYTMKETRACFCPIRGEHDLVVVNNSITTIENDQGQEIPLTNSGFKTIDDLFEFIGSSLSQNPAVARVRYDSTYGYPADVYFDYNANGADEEMGYLINAFVPDTSN